MTGQDLKRWREAQGLTPQALAALIPCHWRTVYKWERGERGLSPMVQARLKDVMRAVEGG
jgi:DNA-binding transcriptional regulator YiaG